MDTIQEYRMLKRRWVESRGEEREQVQKIYHAAEQKVEVLEKDEHSQAHDERQHQPEFFHALFFRPRDEQSGNV